jgi:hypothetical protein
MVNNSGTNIKRGQKRQKTREKNENHGKIDEQCK